MRLRLVILVAAVVPVGAGRVQADEEALPAQVLSAMKRAATFYREQVATHGGYVYHYSLDLKQRWGEGLATQDQIWVQPPGTPTVGLAYLRAHEATGDRYYLDAATEAAVAVAYGQLMSGGWTNSIDFDPVGPRTAAYRNGRGKGKNNSSLDDGQSQSAIRLMMHLDRAHDFRHPIIHESAEVALSALLRAQFPNGGFPQVWTQPVSKQSILKAAFPAYDWRTVGRVKNYWDMYTINDNVCGYLADTLIDAHVIYGDDRYLRALRALGSFLILAQLPEPQPAWAQQYNYEMRPIWARKFEPPAVAGDESQEVIETLMKIFTATHDHRYLEPIPPALAYLERSRLEDGRLARYYELKTNRPLYMVRRGDVYNLTYDDSDLPAHYAWKTTSRLGELNARYEALLTGRATTRASVSLQEIRQIVSDLDDRGRWVSVYDGQRLVGQPKMAVGAKYLSSERFSQNLFTLSEILAHRQRVSRDATIGDGRGR